MPKQMIEVDVPDGFEVDGEAFVSGGYGFNAEMKALFLEVPLRRKLSYKGTPELAKALREAPDDRLGSSFGAFATEDCHIVLKLLPHNYRGTYGLDYWLRSNVLDLGMTELRRPHFLLSKGERWPWVDVRDSFAVKTKAWLVEDLVPDECLSNIRVVLTASAQFTKPEPVPIESDLSEQVTRLLRHLGIDQPPTADEVEDLLSQTLRSLDPVKWADISTELANGSKKRDDWQWPEWLKAKWLVCNKHGMWLASDDEPMRPNHGDPWTIQTFSEWIAVDFTPGHAFVPPPCTDWRRSKRRNPNWIDSP